MQKQIKRLVASLLVAAIVLGMVPAETLEVAAASMKKGYEILMQPTMVYEDIYYDFDNHTAIVTNSKGKRGLIDVNGDTLIPCKWEEAYFTCNGKYVVVINGNKRGLYTNKGKQVFACKYKNIDVINSNCIALQFVKSKKWGLYTAKGKTIVTAQYDYIEVIKGTYVLVEKNGKYGVVTTAGKTSISCAYKDFDIIYNTNKVLLKSDKGYWYICSIDGKSKINIGKYDEVYGYYDGIEARKRVDDITLSVEYSYSGKIVDKSYSSWDGEVVVLKSNDRVLYRDYSTNTLYIYDCALKLKKKITDVTNLRENGLFFKEVYSDTSPINHTYLYNCDAKLLASTKDSIYTSIYNDWSDSDVVVAWTNDGDQHVINKNGTVMAKFSDGAYDVRTFVEGTLLVSYNDGQVLADYKGNLIKSLKSYTDVERHTDKYFTVVTSSGNKHLMDATGNSLGVIGKVNDYVSIYDIYENDNYCEVVNEDSSIGYIINNKTSKVILKIKNYNGVYISEDNKYFQVSCEVNDDYTRGVYSLTGKEYLSPTKYSYVDRMDSNKWLVQNKNTKKWYILNSNFTTYKSLGAWDEVVTRYKYDMNSDKVTEYLYAGVKGGKKTYYTAILTAKGATVVPKGNYKYDYAESNFNSVVVLNSKKQVIAYSNKGKKLCTIPNVKSIVTYDRGMLVYKATNNKYGIIKVTKAGHTHKLTKCSAKKATPTVNGHTAGKKCSICGGYITANLVYSASKISATNKVYTGKTVSTKINVKDAAGKTISKSHYTISGTTKAKKVGTYKVKIKFKGKKYSGSKTITWQIKPVATKIVKVTAGSKKLTVKWGKKKTEVTGYKIQYSTDKKFKKGVKTITVKKNSTTSKTITKLTSKKKYYVRVCTYKGSCTSSWSAVKSVTVK